MVGNLENIIYTFAVLYIFAVIVERFVEFFSLNELQVLCLFNNKAEIEKRKRIIENRQKLIAGITSLSKESTIENIKMEELKREIKELEKEIYKHENVKRKEEKKRIFYLWGIGLIFSLLICFIANIVLEIKLMENIVSEFNGLFDCIVSGLFISGGTKPLHDIIKMLEKFKPTK